MIKDLRTIIADNPKLRIDETLKKTIFASEESQLNELSARKQQITQLNQSFDERYRAIQVSL